MTIERIRKFIRSNNINKFVTPFVKYKHFTATISRAHRRIHTISTRNFPPDILEFIYESKKAYHNVATRRVKYENAARGTLKIRINNAVRALAKAFVSTIRKTERESAVRDLNIMAKACMSWDRCSLLETLFVASKFN